MTLVDFRESVVNKVKETDKFAIDNALHSVITFWVSPFNTLEFTEAYFSSAFEASKYAHGQIDMRSKYKDLDYAVYIDGSLKKNNFKIV